MFIKQIYTTCLAQASYYIESNGCAAIVDPIRDIDAYLQLAKERKAVIQYVLETHFHADFVSGHLELARKTGAVIVFGPEAKPAFPAKVVCDGDTITLGEVKISVLHTPGHTIESSCYLLFNEVNKPYAVFTGDTLFVGDVGRPDLGSGNLPTEELASRLFDSLNKNIKTLPDDVIVYPGHGAGSACGKNLSKETWSTIWEQKISNYALQPMSRETFIYKVTADIPPAPAYFAHDVSANRNGYETLDRVLIQGTRILSKDEFNTEMQKGALVLDVRNSTEFGIGFIKGSLNIGLEGDFAIWSGNLIPSDKAIILVVRDHQEKEAVTRLARIGFDNVIGCLKDDIIGWINEKYPVDHIQTISGTQIDKYIQMGYVALDVRKPSETTSGMIKNTIHIPLEQLSGRTNELMPGKKYLVYCAGGYRSMIAASILKAKGFTDVKNVRGGITQIRKESPQMIVKP
ncbi:MAG: rhodanese-like domain-containing protein [Bacteroidia bacterium]